MKNQLYLLYVHPMLSVTDSLQFINLPCSVSQSSDESETKSEKTKTAVRGFPFKTIDLIRSQNNQTKTFQSKSYFNPFFRYCYSK